MRCAKKLYIQGNSVSRRVASADGVGRFRLGKVTFNFVSGLLIASALSGCTEIEIDRTTPSAWYYERYSPQRDRIVRLPSGPARVLVFEQVHFAKPIYDKSGEDVGHWNGWRTEIEVFFPKDQVPPASEEAARNAAMQVCDEFKVFEILEEHPHYVRFASYC